MRSVLGIVHCVTLLAGRGDFIVCHRLPGHIRWPCRGKPRSMLLCLGRKVFCRRKQRAFLTLFRRFTVLNNSE